jgi:hypothetical protein
MPKAYSLLSWNVEHFKNDSARVDRVAGLLKKQKPDVLALYEVEGKEVFGALTDAMPGYTFHITEGPQTQEILVGVRSAFSAFFTQKLEFRSGASMMRPGALLTLTIAGKHYPILFLHTASGNDPRGLGLRDDMLVRACEFAATLGKVAPAAGPANYLFLGDLNTMGMQYRYVPAHNIPATDELVKLGKHADKSGMRILTKSAPATWSNGSNSRTPPSNLDHVVAARHLKFRAFDGAEVAVRGWPELATAAQQDKWIAEYSDHGYLYLEVQRAKE